MNLRCVSLGLLLVFAAGVAGAKTATAPAAAEETGFRVCVIDESRGNASAERAGLRARIVSCLQETLGQGWRELRDEKVKVGTAARRLKTRACDAVILFGPKRPWRLRRLDVVTFAVDLGPEHAYEPVYLIVPAREQTLQETILAGFPKALAPLHPRSVMLAVR